MAKETLYFHRLQEYCGRPLHVAAVGEPVSAAAMRMRDANVSSLWVCDSDGRPLGVVTDRDLRNKVLAAGLDPNGTRLEEVMSAPVVSVGEEEPLFEALARMTRLGIHRVAIVDGGGRLSGVLTDSDLLRLEAASPLLLLKGLEEADSVEALKPLHEEVTGLVQQLQRSGVKTQDLTRLISKVNDAVVSRLFRLLREAEFPDLPDGFAFVALGSEGRGEQTLKTDQDNAIVYEDGLSEAEIDRIRAFSQKLIDGLIALGVPPCPGGVMAKNPQWRRSLSEWDEALTEWARTPTPDNILNFSMFADVRFIQGKESLVLALKEKLERLAAENTLFVSRMAGNIVRFPPPLGWFGRIKVVAAGEHRGSFDVKKSGIFAFTEGAKLMALSRGLRERGTLERLDALGAAGEFTPDELLEYKTHYGYLVFLRLKGQIESVSRGETPTDYVSLKGLNVVERSRLVLAFRHVKSFLNHLKLRFHVE